MSTNLTSVSGPATDLIEKIEAKGFKSHGQSLTKFAPWQRLKRLVLHMEKAVNLCWVIVAEVRDKIKGLTLRHGRSPK